MGNSLTKITQVVKTVEIGHQKGCEAAGTGKKALDNKNSLSGKEAKLEQKGDADH